MIFAAIASLALSTQGPDWVARPPPSLPGSIHETMAHYRFFNNCVATRDWAIAGPMFDTRIGSAEEQRILRRVTGGREGTECSYAVRMRMTSVLMRGGIAEARYRHVYRRSAAIPPARAAISPAPEGASFEWVGFNRDSPAPELLQFANCLAERETGSVHSLLLTGYGTGEERAAFQSLSRRFGTCLQVGQQLRANSLTLRPWLAEAQYQFLRSGEPDRGE